MNEKSNLILARQSWEKYRFDKFCTLELITRGLSSVRLYGDIKAPLIFHQHVSYILTEWMCNKQDVSDLPHQLFGCEDHLAFCNKYIDKLTVHLFTKGEEEQLLQILHNLNLDYKQILQVKTTRNYFLCPKISAALQLHHWF